jgi:hypothetical protein
VSGGGTVPQPTDCLCPRLIYPMHRAQAIRRLTDCTTLPCTSATPGPPKSLAGIQSAVPRAQDRSAHTYKPMYATPAGFG